MEMELSKAEIRLFALFIAKGELSLEEIAKKGKISHSRASRLVKSLETKGFLISKANRRKKVVGLSNSAHSLALKELIESSPHMKFDEILGNSALRVLMGFSETGNTTAQIAKSSAKPLITVKRAIANLMLKGIVLQSKRGIYESKLPGISKFLKAYSFFAAENIRKGIGGSLIVRGNWALLRTSARNLPGIFVKTGLSVFNEFGITIIQTDYRDYYFSILGKAKKPSMEEALVHAMVRSTTLNSTREISYVLLAMEKNLKKIDMGKFMEVAKRYGVESISEECWEYLGNFDKPESEVAKVKLPFNPSGFLRVEGPILPSKEEFLDLVKQYG